MILAIGLVCSVVIITAVLVGGGIYQKILFEEYLEDLEDPKKPPTENNPNLPSIDILP